MSKGGAMNRRGYIRLIVILNILLVVVGCRNQEGASEESDEKRRYLALFR